LGPRLKAPPIVQIPERSTWGALGVFGLADCVPWFLSAAGCPPDWANIIGEKSSMATRAARQDVK
jgi:hypothetical protein